MKTLDWETINDTTTRCTDLYVDTGRDMSLWLTAYAPQYGRKVPFFTATLKAAGNLVATSSADEVVTFGDFATTVRIGRTAFHLRTPAIQQTIRDWHAAVLADCAATTPPEPATP